MIFCCSPYCTYILLSSSVPRPTFFITRYLLPGILFLLYIVFRLVFLFLSLPPLHYPFFLLLNINSNRLTHIIYYDMICDLTKSDHSHWHESFKGNNNLLRHMESLWWIYVCLLVLHYIFSAVDIFRWKQS